MKATTSAARKAEPMTSAAITTERVTSQGVKARKGRAEPTKLAKAHRKALIRQEPSTEGARVYSIPSSAFDRPGVSSGMAAILDEAKGTASERTDLGQCSYCTDRALGRDEDGELTCGNPASCMAVIRQVPSAPLPLATTVDAPVNLPSPEPPTVDTLALRYVDAAREADKAEKAKKEAGSALLRAMSEANVPLVKLESGDKVRRIEGGTAQADDVQALKTQFGLLWEAYDRLHNLAAEKGIPSPMPQIPRTVPTKLVVRESHVRIGRI